MPTGRLTMRRIRDLLRLKFAQGLSDRAVAASLGLGKGSVSSYLRRARDAGLSWPLPEGLDDDSLELLLFPASPSLQSEERPIPDWAAIDKKMRKSGVTRMLLWQEYRARHPEGFAYTWFCTTYDAWKGRVRPTMRQSHVGGEKVFVDFSGDTVDVVDPSTGEVPPAKLVVGTSRQRRAYGIGAPPARRARRATPMPRRWLRKAWKTGSGRIPACSPSSAACRRS